MGTTPPGEAGRKSGRGRDDAHCLPGEEERVRAHTTRHHPARRGTTPVTRWGLRRGRGRGEATPPGEEPRETVTTHTHHPVRRQEDGRARHPPLSEEEGTTPPGERAGERGGRRHPRLGGRLALF